VAEKADPFTRPRLLDLAKRYEAKDNSSGSIRAVAAPQPGLDALRRLRRSMTKGDQVRRLQRHGPPAGARDRARQQDLYGPLREVRRQGRLPKAR
jgi:hypothetical protein